VSHKIEDLLFTIDICRKSLPGNTNPVHLERLWHIENLLKARDRAEKAMEAKEAERRNGQANLHRLRR
jgi:hypothetical protein